MIGPQKSPVTTARILAQTKAIRKQMKEMPSATSILRPDSFLSVPGYLYDVEGYLLAELASGRDVLEIGAHLGRSSVAMAYSANSVTSIEHFKGDTMLNEIPKEEYHKNIRNAGATRKTELVEADFFSLYAEGKINLLDYSMIFYDGNHQPPLPYERDFFEIILALYKAPRIAQDERKPQVRILAVHDVKRQEEAFKHTVEACDWFTQESGVPMQGNAEHGSVRWWELEF